MEICVNEKEVVREGNYLKIKITDDLLQKLGGLVKLSSLKPGQTFRDSLGVEYIVLDQSKETTAVLRKNLLDKDMQFGGDNNWENSKIRSFLNGDYFTYLCKEFGNNIVEHTTDLLSLDGLDDYGKVQDKVGLLTIDHYRRYRKVLGENMPRWWWLSTPDSTPSGWSTRCGQCVGGNGCVNCFGYDYSGGVRPFFILNSSILVSSSSYKN